MNKRMFFDGKCHALNGKLIVTQSLSQFGDVQGDGLRECARAAVEHGRAEGRTTARRGPVGAPRHSSRRGEYTVGVRWG